MNEKDIVNVKKPELIIFAKTLEIIEVYDYEWTNEEMQNYFTAIGHTQQPLPA